MSRALVTGAAGFVGGHLAAHLAAAGDEVVAVDREVDVTDGGAVRAALDEVRPGVIYHLAALAHVGASWREPDEYERVNGGGAAAVFDAARDVVPAARVVLVSTAEVYGVVAEGDLPLTEARPVAPANPYAASKVHAERHAAAAAARGQWVVVARPFNQFGPGQSERFVVPALAARLARAARTNELEVPVGDLSPRRDFTDVRDAVAAYRLLATRGAPGETYQVCSGEPVAIATVARELAARLCPDARFVVDGDLVRPVETPASWGRYDKLRAATGWEPTIARARTLDDVAAEARAAGERRGSEGDGPAN